MTTLTIYLVNVPPVELQFSDPTDNLNDQERLDRIKGDLANAIASPTAFSFVEFRVTSIRTILVRESAIIGYMEVRE